MNKIIIAIIALSLSLCLNAQYTNGTGLNYNNAYGYIRLQNFEIRNIYYQANFKNRMMVVTQNSNAFDVNDIIAAVSLDEANKTTSTFQTDLFVQRLNLSDPKVLQLKDNQTGNLTSPFKFFVIDSTNYQVQNEVSIDHSENCTYFNVSSKSASQLYNCNMGFANTNQTFNMNITITLPTLLSVSSDKKYQIRLTLDNANLTQYSVNNNNTQPTSNQSFPFLNYDFGNITKDLFVNPANASQQDKLCNLSATIDVQNNTLIDPCFVVKYEGSKSYNKFIAMHYCVDKLPIGEDKITLQTCASSTFEFETNRVTEKIIVSKLVSVPQTVTIGHDLHDCQTTFGQMLTVQNLMIVALVFVSSVFA